MSATAIPADHRSRASARAPATAIPVKVQTLIEKNIAQTTSTTGYLTADKNTMITPRASGYIKSIDFHEGAFVNAGDTLFQLNDQAEKNALAAAQATFALSKIQYDRDKTLLTRGFITQNVFYTAKMTLKQNQAALQVAELNLRDRAIKAPFSGTAGSIDVSLGDLVNPGKQLTTLVDNQHLRVVYTLPSTHLNQIKVGQSVSIVNDADKKPIVATVNYVSPQVAQATQTIAVHAAIDNTAQQLKPGEYVTITQTIGESKHVLLVPEQSVLASMNRYTVFIAKNNHAIRVPVTVGQHVDGHVVVTAGLKPNDQLIIAGQDQLKNNAPIIIQ